MRSITSDAIVASKRGEDIGRDIGEDTPPVLTPDSPPASAMQWAFTLARIHNSLRSSNPIQAQTVRELAGICARAAINAGLKDTQSALHNVTVEAAIWAAAALTAAPSGGASLALPSTLISAARGARMGLQAYKVGRASLNVMSDTQTVQSIIDNTIISMPVEDRLALSSALRGAQADQRVTATSEATALAELANAVLDSMPSSAPKQLVDVYRDKPVLQAYYAAMDSAIVASANTKGGTAGRTLAEVLSSAGTDMASAEGAGLIVDLVIQALFDVDKTVLMRKVHGGTQMVANARETMTDPSLGYGGDLLATALSITYAPQSGGVTRRAPVRPPIEWGQDAIRTQRALNIASLIGGRAGYRLKASIMRESPDPMDWELGDSFIDHIARAGLTADMGWFKDYKSSVEMESVMTKVRSSIIGGGLNDARRIEGDEYAGTGRQEANVLFRLLQSAAFPDRTGAGSSSSLDLGDIVANAPGSGA